VSGERDPYHCPGCHDGDFPDFDHYVDVMGIPPERVPDAFAVWLAGAHGLDEVRHEAVEEVTDG